MKKWRHEAPHIFCLSVQRLGEKLNSILNFDLGWKHIIICFYLDKKNTSIFEYNNIMYRLWFLRIKWHVEGKKKQIQSVHTHSPRIVSKEILYSKILPLVQWVKIIIQNAYKLYKFLVYGLFKYFTTVLQYAFSR